MIPNGKQVIPAWGGERSLEKGYMNLELLCRGPISSEQSLSLVVYKLFG